MGTSCTPLHLATSPDTLDLRSALVVGSDHQVPGRRPKAGQPLERLLVQRQRRHRDEVQHDGRSLEHPPRREPLLKILGPWQFLGDIRAVARGNPRAKLVRSGILAPKGAPHRMIDVRRVAQNHCAMIERLQLVGRRLLLLLRWRPHDCDVLLLPGRHLLRRGTSDLGVVPLVDQGGQFELATGGRPRARRRRRPARRLSRRALPLLDGRKRVDVYKELRAPTALKKGRFLCEAPQQPRLRCFDQCQLSLARFRNTRCSNPPRPNICWQNRNVPQRVA